MTESLHPGGESPGRCFLVGAGPGDPELLTLRACKAIQSATLLLADDLVSAEILALAPPRARIIHVGKRGGRVSTPQAFIERLMLMAVREGETVVRLKGAIRSFSGAAARRPSTCAPRACAWRWSTASRRAWRRPHRWASRSPTGNMPTV